MVSVLRESPRVVVVGGGIIGLSTAWRIARTGASVCVLERRAFAAEATRVAAGMLAPISESDPAESLLLELGLASTAAWPQFAADLEIDAGLPTDSLLDRTGTLLIARDADEGRWLEREAAIRAEQQLDCTLLTPREARALEPDLAPGLRGALHVPGDYAVDPRAIADALITACRARGVELAEHTPVDGLDDPQLAAPTA